MNDSIRQVLAELIGNGVGQFKAAVPVAWTVPAVVMILWTGLKIVVSRKFDAWEILRLVVVLGVARMMLAFYWR